MKRSCCCAKGRVFSKSCRRALAMLWRVPRHSLTTVPILKSPVGGVSARNSWARRSIARSKAPKYHPALRHRRTISPRNGADSWHLSWRRESTCFPRTPEVTPHRVSRAPTRPRELNVFLGDVGKREEANLAFAPELRQRLIY